MNRVPFNMKIRPETKIMLRELVEHTARPSMTNVVEWLIREKHYELRCPAPGSLCFSAPQLPDERYAAEE